MSKTKKNTAFLDFVYNFYKGMKTHEITLAYEGEINHEIMKAFTSLAERSMSKDEEPEILQKKVYHVMVECLQNITKHAFHSENIYSPDYAYNRGILLVGRNQKEYTVTTGNIIEKERKTNLVELLNHINSLSKDDLNKLYVTQLKNGHLSEKGGAGLGFIDIRRKTGSELIFQFLPVSESHEFFLFTSTISRIT
jgi:hypothetical protein